MKVYSSKKAALNNINVDKYRSVLYCTGKYKTSIKTMDVSNDKKQKGQKTMKLQLLLSDLKEVNKELKKTWIRTKHIPVLDHLKIEVKNSIATFTILNTTTVASYKIKAQGTQEGTATIPYVEFDKLVRKLKSDYVTIETEQSETITVLKTDKNEFKFDNLSSQYPVDFKLESKEYETKYLSVDFKRLNETLQQPLKVVSKLDSRPILTGVNFTLESDLLTVVATDSHRLARNKMKVLNNHEYNFVLPGIELGKMLRMNFNSVVNIEVYQQYVVFNDNKLTVTIKRLEGNYPATDQLIPQDFNAVFKVDRKELLNDLELSKIMIDKDKNNSINLQATSEQVVLKNDVAGVKNILVPFDYKSSEVENVDFHFNLNYMIETLKQISSDRVEVKFVSKLRPFIVNDPSNTTLDNLITPIRTRG